MTFDSAGGSLGKRWFKIYDRQCSARERHDAEDKKSPARPDEGKGEIKQCHQPAPTKNDEGQRGWQVIPKGVFLRVH